MIRRSKRILKGGTREVVLKGGNRWVRDDGVESEAGIWVVEVVEVKGEGSYDP